MSKKNAYNIDKKRQILQRLNIEIEPYKENIKSKNKDLKKLSDFFFFVVNNFSVRHSNGKETDYDCDYDYQDYIKLYNAAFNAGVSILDYF